MFVSLLSVSFTCKFLTALQVPVDDISVEMEQLTVQLHLLHLISPQVYILILNMVITWFKGHGICKSHINYTIAYPKQQNKSILFTTHDCPCSS